MSAESTCPASPPGYFYRGGCELLCRPTTWSDLLVFYLGNYVAHVATIVSTPGQSPAASILFPMMALIFPGTGVSRALGAIMSLAIFAPTELQMAARAGALYTVVPIPLYTLLPVKTLVPVKSFLSRRLSIGDRGPKIGVDSDQQRAGDRDPDGSDEQITRVGAGSADVEAAAGSPGSGEETQRGPDQGNQDLREEPIEVPLFLSPGVHGAFRLPKGYRLVAVGPDARFLNDPEDPPVSMGKRVLSYFTAAFRARRSDRAAVACDYNAVRIVAALVQLAFGTATLYRTRGDQIDAFGYAAFGLTVAQYSWMSALNLLGSLVCPNYPSAYVVESQTLKNLRARIEADNMTKKFPLTGTIGELHPNCENKILESRGDNAKHRLWSGGPSIEALSDFVDKTYVLFSAAIYVGAAPLTVIGGMSRFLPGNSALYQRVWTMMWLASGISMGPLLATLAEIALKYPTKSKLPSTSVIAAFVALGVQILSVYAAPAVGGFVVVGQMIVEYGSCVRLG